MQTQSSGGWLMQLPTWRAGMNQGRYPGLQLDEDMPLQRREWLVQRIAWAVLSALLLAIVLGLFGSGPLSHSVARTADGSVEAEYERFMRNRSPETMRLTVHPDSGAVMLLFDAEYLRRIEIKRIVPEPDQILFGMDAAALVFTADAPGPMRIAIHFQPEKVGMLKGWVMQDGRPRLELGQFVFP